jgi:hypothetical protein
MLYLFPIPILVFEFTVGFINQATSVYIMPFGGWSIFSHLAFFVYGYLFASNLKFKETIEKHALPALITTLVTGILLFFLDGFNIDQSVRDILFLVIATFYTWSVLICLFAMGSKFLNRNNKSRKFMNELVMPFYVIHQTIILVIGFFIVQLDMHFFAKYIIIMLTAFTTCAILLVPIKYLNPLRFIFGMRWKKGLLKKTTKEEVVKIEAQIEESPISETNTQ